MSQLRCLVKRRWCLASLKVICFVVSCQSGLLITPNNQESLKTAAECVCVRSAIHYMRKPIKDTEMRFSGVGTSCFILHAQGVMGKRSRQRNVAKEIEFL